MSSTIEQYREAKTQYLKLRNQARKDLVLRFHALANELLQVQRELLEDFGEKIALPARSKKGRAVKAGKTAEAKPAALPPPKAAGPPSPKVIALEKQLNGLKKKLSDTQAAGKPMKAMEDRIYELEDELRLAQG